MNVFNAGMSAVFDVLLAPFGHRWVGFDLVVWPVLAGTELVGHVDPKADRPSRRLRVVSRRIQRGHGVADSVKDFARWLGLR